MSKDSSLFFIGVGAIWIPILFSNCSPAFNLDQDPQQPLELASNATPGLEPSLDPNSAFLITFEQPNLQLDLGTSSAVNVTIKNNSNYQGPISLSLDLGDLPSRDTRQGLFINSNLSDTITEPGKTHTATLDIFARTDSPSLSDYLVIQIKDKDNKLVSERGYQVTINPKVTIETRGVGDQNWQIGGLSINQHFETGTRRIPFVSHRSGLSVVFINRDSQNRIIHSSGAIAHQALSGMQTEGSYLPTPIRPGNPVNAPVYYHNGEGSAAARDLRFNVDTILTQSQQHKVTETNALDSENWSVAHKPGECL